MPLALLCSLLLLFEINNYLSCQIINEVSLVKFCEHSVGGGISVAEHATADREVAGSIPSLPFLWYTFYFAKYYNNYLNLNFGAINSTNFSNQQFLGQIISDDWASGFLATVRPFGRPAGCSSPK